MNKQKILKTLLIASLTIMVASVTIFVVQKCTQLKPQKSFPDYSHLILRQVAKLEQQTRGLIIDNQWAYWGNDSLKLVNLQQLATEERIYFYFSQNVCPPCVMSAIELIEKYIPDYEQNETLVFISPDWPHRLRNDCYGKRLLMLQQERLGISLEDENVPFFFRLNAQMELTSVHIVAKVDFKRTEVFLKKYVYN